jgi:hypothetical protein
LGSSVFIYFRRYNTTHYPAVASGFGKVAITSLDDMAPSLEKRQTRLKRKRYDHDPGGSTREPGKMRIQKEQKFNEGESARELARPYLLAVGMLRLDVLDTTWSDTKNREVDENHVEYLKKIFREDGLERRNYDHWISGLCSAAEVQSVANVTDGGREKEARFLNWAMVNDKKVELITGQHRISALRKYVEEIGGQEDDLWWMCELYDEGMSFLGEGKGGRGSCIFLVQEKYGKANNN